jgi:hypothetical protein
MRPVTNVASDEIVAKESYLRVKDDWAALQSDQLLQVNLEPYFAAETVLGALVRLKSYEEAMAKLTGADSELIGKLQDYVLGLKYIQGRYVMATKAPNNFDTLVEEANKLNDILEADARALALRGLFDKEKLNRLQGGNSYKALADDLEALASEFEHIYPQIQGKCATTPEDIKAATQMSTRLARIRGEEQLSPAAVAAITEERQRAFTQLIKAYDEARAAITFIRRREGDAEQIAPNLYAANNRRRKALEAAPAAPPPVPTAPAPAPPAATDGAPTGAPNGPTPKTSQPFLT